MSAKGQDTFKGKYLFSDSKDTPVGLVKESSDTPQLFNVEQTVKDLEQLE